MGKQTIEVVVRDERGRGDGGCSGCGGCGCLTLLVVICFLLLFL